MSFFTIFILGGLALMVMGLVEVVRRVRWGDPFFGEGVSDVREVMRLQELNRRIRDVIAETVKNAQQCYQIFRVLASTRFRDATDPSLFVLRDNIWRRSREEAVKSARKGYRDSDRFLRLSMDSAILLLREAFRFSIETCMSCPLLRGRPGGIKQCPITETLKTEAQPQQQ
jgi:hypothetical protein